MNSLTAEHILDVLNGLYPHTRDDMNFLKFRNPFEILIMTILSAQTTDKTVNGLRDELFDAYPNAYALSKAQIEDVERIIKPTGFYHAKAKNIVGAAKKLVTDFHGEVPNTIDELITLPGVGRKTANIVTNHAYHKIYGIAVDTHVKRLSQRLGFSTEEEPEKIEQDLLRLLHKKYWEHVNYLLISHGRAICRAKKPICDSCIIKGECKYHGRAGKKP